MVRLNRIRMIPIAIVLSERLVPAIKPSIVIIYGKNTVRNLKRAKEVKKRIEACDFLPNPNDPNFYCRVCELTLSKQNSLVSHIRVLHNLDSTYTYNYVIAEPSLFDYYPEYCNSRFACKRCDGFSFETRPKFHDHFRNFSSAPTTNWRLRQLSFPDADGQRDNIFSQPPPALKETRIITFEDLIASTAGGFDRITVNNNTHVEISDDEDEVYVQDINWNFKEPQGYVQHLNVHCIELNDAKDGGLIEAHGYTCTTCHVKYDTKGRCLRNQIKDKWMYEVSINVLNHTDKRYTPFLPDQETDVTRYHVYQKQLGIPSPKHFCIECRIKSLKDKVLKEQHLSLHSWNRATRVNSAYWNGIHAINQLLDLNEFAIPPF
ncbi:hypothetical protein BDF21DRAFT_451748 [Thamnidium elegans]|nr:hypothetical protein BDF21DRAFT_451748 [Thamnidium elegans]